MDEKKNLVYRQGDLVFDVESGDGGPYSEKSQKAGTAWTLTKNGDFVIRTGGAERARITSAGVGSGFFNANPTISSGAFSAGPPASPADGDIWIGTNVNGTSGVSWQFRFDSSSGSTSKWEFVGGAPLVFVTTTAPTWGTTNAWHAWPGLSYTVERAGDYVSWGGFAGQGNGGGATSVFASFDQVSGAGADPGAASNFNIGVPPFQQTLSVSAGLALSYFVTGLPNSIRSASISILPKRVS